MLHHLFIPTACQDKIILGCDTLVWYKLITGREIFATLIVMVEKNPEEGGNKFLRNVLKFLPDYTSSHP